MRKKEANFRVDAFYWRKQQQIVQLIVNTALFASIIMFAFITVNGFWTKLV